VGVVCQGDTVCRGDRCVGACDGVACPGSQICRLGRCVDPCAGVTCGTGQACVNGACVTGCDCYPCLDPALACSKSSNVCVDKGCESLTCSAGTVCKRGECVAGCTGVVCPSGQECKLGQCIDLPMPTDSDGPPVDTVGASVAEGCSCRLSPGEDSSPGPAVWGLLGTALAAAFLSTRKRRPRAS
jgi:MYXO-CTERM domain-containing protein